MEKKEAMKILKDFHDKSALFSVRTALDTVFPELAESEDERIRKYLIQMAQNGHGGDKDWWNKCVAWLEKQSEHKKFRDNIQVGDKVTRNEDGILVNLSQLNRVAKKDEKRGEQKPYGLREECKDCQCNYAGECKGSCAMKRNEQNPIPKFEVGDIMRTLQEVADGMTDGMPVVVSIDDKYYRCNNELIAIKDQDDYEYPPMNRKRKPAEWSEEDKDAIDNIISILNDEQNNYQTLSSDYNRLEKLKNKLKSLRFQSHWKPSDEQMEVLVWCMPLFVDPKSKAVLESLIKDLKKLREE